MSSLVNSLGKLFKAGRKRIGNAIDNFWLDPEAKKAIEAEVRSKFQPKIDLVDRVRSRRAANITDLDKKLTESKDNWQKAQNQWKQNYDSALADAKAQRQTDINNYNTELKGYQDAVDTANANKKSIENQLYQQEATVNLNNTIFTDVNTGETYIFDPLSGGYKNLKAYRSGLRNKQDKKAFSARFQNPEYRLFNKDSGKIINVFNSKDARAYGSEPLFTSYLDRVRGPKDIDLRNADDQINKAQADLSTWQKKSAPTPWDDSVDSKQFLKDYKKTNGSLPTEYSFNGQTYKNVTDLNQAYKDALDREQHMIKLANTKASKYTSRRDAEIAKRIQDAKDIKKAKLALGAGALAAGAAAMYGGDDTPDTSDTPDNIDNTDNTYIGEPDPNISIENTPEGKAALNGKSLVDTDFDPDKAAAVAALSQGAYDKGVEDGDAIRASDIARADGQPMEDELFELLKAMKDPYKADAIANYIYSRHGNDLEVRRRGWRAWLDRNYGDPLRSKMNIDPSGYKGMHISGGL